MNLFIKQKEKNKNKKNKTERDPQIQKTNLRSPKGVSEGWGGRRDKLGDWD